MEARHGAQSLLKRAVELGASDIHLKVGLPPILRRDGELSPLDEYAILMDKDMDALIEVVGARSPERLEAFKKTGDLDIAFRTATFLGSASTPSGSAGIPRSRFASSRKESRPSRCSVCRPASRGWRTGIAGSCW